jgi:hypothetical protein
VCKRGVRQGDPLSPLLYIFGSDLLQSAINDMVVHGTLSWPIETNDLDFSIIQYIDDTLLILRDDVAQVKALKDTLEKYSKSIGLRITYSKLQMIPINVDDELMVQLSEEFRCQVGSMPFTYLGLPLETTRPIMSDLMPLVCRLERKLSSSSSFLAHGARLQLINFALASMPLHFLCSLQLSPGFTKQLDRILRQCLWRDFENANKPSLAAWEMVCKSKQKGGLVICPFCITILYHNLLLFIDIFHI